MPHSAVPQAAPAARSRQPEPLALRLRPPNPIRPDRAPARGIAFQAMCARAILALVFRLEAGNTLRLEGGAKNRKAQRAEGR
ncbi:MAG: hypothetical protein ACHQ50_04690 [Fimbriimonadales bacterium]